MRAHHAIAVAAVILFGFGMKLLFFSVRIAESDIRVVKGMDISKMHENKNLPSQTMHDMTFVYSDDDQSSDLKK